MSKFSVLLAVLLLVGIAYLAYDPTPAQAAWNWGRKQFGLDRTDLKPMGTPNYMPVTPKGL